MDYKNINDYELIYQIRENDDTSLNILVKKYEPLIAKSARKYFSVSKYQGIELSDLVQEGRIAVIKALSSYDPDGDTLFYTYADVCINRHLITYCRSLNAMKNSALNYSVSDECLYLVGDMSYEPFRCLGYKCDEAFLKEYFYSLDFIDGNILELRFNGFSYKEISELLDISFTVITRRLCKIRKTLQRLKDKF